MSPKIPKPLFYLLTFTWGLPLTLLGFLIVPWLFLAGLRPKKWGYCYYFEFGENWGGTELGLFFLVNRNSSERIRNHEHGHAIQNCYLGPVMLPIICLPSFLRYWYRELRYNRRGKRPKTGYDDIWFEGSATRLGTGLTTWLEEQTK